jgi:hypothetical protein
MKRKNTSFAPVNSAVRLLPLNATYRTWLRLMVAIQKARTIDVHTLSVRTGISAAKIGTLLDAFQTYGWIKNGRVVAGWFNTLFANATSYGSRNVTGGNVRAFSRRAA